MKLVCFDDFKLGVVKGADAIVDITPIVREVAQGDPRLLINAVIDMFAYYNKRIEGAVSVMSQASSQAGPGRESAVLLQSPAFESAAALVGDAGSRHAVERAAGRARQRQR